MKTMFRTIQLICLLFITTFPIKLARADEYLPPNAEEQKVIDDGKFDAQVYPRANIILAWPRNHLEINWEAGFGVTSVSELADFIDKFFVRVEAEDIFNLNPQTATGVPDWAKNRLVISFFYDPEHESWDGCWLSDNRISFCSPFAKEIGTRDWFGTLIHEMTHYFGQFRFHSLGYVEGMADFMRYYGSKLLGWNDIAAKNRQTYYDTCYQTFLPTYHGAAGALIELFEKNHYPTVQAMILDLKANDFRNAFPPLFEYFSYSGFKTSTIAYCQETRNLKDIYPVETETRFREEIVNGFWGLAYMRSMLDYPEYYQTATETQPRMPIVMSSLQKYADLLQVDTSAEKAAAEAIGKPGAIDPELLSKASNDLNALLEKLSNRAELIFKL
jgi:hypothetical protein